MHDIVEPFWSNVERSNQVETMENRFFSRDTQCSRAAHCRIALFCIVRQSDDIKEGVISNVLGSPSPV